MRSRLNCRAQSDVHLSSRPFMHRIDWQFPGRRGDSLERKRPSRKRRDRAFRPDRTGALEERISLSAFGATGRGTTLASGAGDLPSDSSSRRATLERANPTIRRGSWIKVRDLAYPTATGPGERLDVYHSEGPVPPSGRPVLIAIHGGGWRKNNKAGYGKRVAEALVAHGYVVVAPNYE